MGGSSARLETLEMQSIMERAALNRAQPRAGGRLLPFSCHFWLNSIFNSAIDQ